MNLYIRYFDEEFLAKTVDEAFEFLSNIPDVYLDDSLKENLRQYAEGSMPYPKRYKVKARAYFIVIKTDAETLEEFKNKRNASPVAEPSNEQSVSDSRKDVVTPVANGSCAGWYDGSVMFKRVISIPGTNKFQYKDTVFRAVLKAENGIDCYNRIISHLKSRQDVDLRSQFPSVKGKNFTYQYLGEDRPIFN